jgi:hypothetical protein
MCYDVMWSFSRFAERNVVEVHYEINSHAYNKGYYLADGTYVAWSAFTKTICNPQEEKYQRFAKEQRLVGRCGAGIWCTLISVGYF